MNDPSVSAPVSKCADQIVVSDRIPDEHLAFRFNQGPAEVVFVAHEDTVPLKWIFVAYRYPNGQHDSMTVRPEAVMQVYPAPAPVGLDYSRADDGEVTQSIGVREPMHTGAWTDGGLVDETPGVPVHFVIQSGSDEGFTMCGYSPQGVPAEHLLSDTWDGVTCPECASEAPF